MQRFYIVCLFIYTLALVSCGKYAEITIGDISNINIEGFENNALAVSMSIPIDNPTRHKITITGFDTRVFMNDQYLGKITSSDQPVVIKAKSNSIHEVKLNIQLANLFGMAMNLMNLKKGKRVRLRLEGEVTARSMLIKKRIPINESREIVF